MHFVGTVVLMHGLNRTKLKFFSLYIFKNTIKLAVIVLYLTETHVV